VDTCDELREEEQGLEKPPSIGSVILPTRGLQGRLALVCCMVSGSIRLPTSAARVLPAVRLARIVHEILKVATDPGVIASDSFATAGLLRPQRERVRTNR